MTLHGIYIAAFTVVAVAVGSVTASEDYYRGKIRNRLLLMGLAAGVILYLGFTIYLALAPGEAGIQGAYFRDVLVNSAAAFVAGLLMWKFALWSAGDAKLFAVLAFLTPLEYYERGYMDYFPAFNLLVNIFAVSFVMVVIKVLFGLASPVEKAGQTGSAKNEAGNFFSNISEKWPQFLIMFVIFNAIMLGMNALRPMIGGGRIGQIIMSGTFLLMIFVAMKPITKKLEDFFETHPGARPWTLAVIPMAIGFAAATGSTGAVAGTAKTTAGFMIVVGVAKKLLETRLGTTDVAQVKVKNLRSGMLPTESSIENIPDEANLGTVFMDGLTSEQAEAIKNVMEAETDIEIHLTMPFAPAALGGLLLTFYLKQSIVHYLMAMYR